MIDFVISENDLQTYDEVFDSNTLKHFGILGMKWGVRRYQNPDGSLTEAGRERYGYSDSEPASKSALAGIINKATDKVNAKTEQINASTSARNELAKSLKNRNVQDTTNSKSQSTVSQKVELSEDAIDRIYKKVSDKKLTTAKEIEDDEEIQKEIRKEIDKAERRQIVESADAALVQENASRLTNQELQEAVNRINLMQQINSKVPVKPSTMDKITNAVDKIAKGADLATKGIDTYNKIAKIYNKFSDDSLPVLDKSLSERNEEARRKAKEEKERKEKEQREKDIYKILRTGNADKIINAVNDYEMDPKEIENAKKTYQNMANLYQNSKKNKTKTELQNQENTNNETPSQKKTKKKK